MPYPESKFQSAFTKWLREQQKEGNFLFSFGYELKVKKTGKRLNFKSDFQPQQLSKLKQTKDGCVHKKLSDIDPSLKPYDGMNVCGNAFLIIHWYNKGKDSYMYWMDVNEVLLFKKYHKSISERDADILNFYKFKI